MWENSSERETVVKVLITWCNHRRHQGYLLKKTILNWKKKKAIKFCQCGNDWILNIMQEHKNQQVSTRYNFWQRIYYDQNCYSVIARWTTTPGTRCTLQFFSHCQRKKMVLPNQSKFGIYELWWFAHIKIQATC